jgi:subtilisin family serine protease
MDIRHSSIFMFMFLLCISSISPASNNIYSKSEYIKLKVPKDHDFTKIEENAKYRPGHLLVRFAPKPDGKTRNITEKKQILKKIGKAKIKKIYKNSSDLTLVELPLGQTVKDALKLYNKRDDIFYAEPDYEIQLLSTFPNDTYFEYLWGMNNTGQTGGTNDADIDALEAWDIITDANDIIIAVLDTGVDYTHPDLAANMWITDEDPNDANDDGYPGIGGEDDDGDGLIDEDSNGTSRYIDVENEIEDPNWTNDLFEDDDENGYANDIYGYDFS